MNGAEREGAQIYGVIRGVHWSFRSAVYGYERVIRYW